jgi:hypothetical protein
MRQDIIDLINQAVGEANLGNRQQSQFIFGRVLELEPQNETALLWLAFLTPNPFVAAELLEGLLKRNPADNRLRNYLDQARARCAELSKASAQELQDAPPGTFRLKASSSSYEYRDIAPSNRAVPYLGEFLMQEGFINQHQLNVALRMHYDMALRGQPKRVGEVMIQLGYLTPQQLEHSLALQQSASHHVYSG